MHSFSEFHPVKLSGELFPGQLCLLRELLSYDVRCLHSTVFTREENGKILFDLPPGCMHWSRQFELPWALYHSNLQSSHKVLDVGSGWSIFKFALASRVKEVTCLELDREALRKSQDTIDKFGFSNIQQVQGDLRKLPFVDNTFDRVFCISVLEHVPKDHNLGIKEMLRVLRPGGCLILTMDVVLEGECKGEFYVNLEKINELYKEGLFPPLTEESNKYERIFGAKMEEGVSISVVMSRLVKA